MKNLFLILLTTCNFLSIYAQKPLSFNYSFHGDYSPEVNDYSLNMDIDTSANISFYVSYDKSKIIVTSETDTLFQHHIISIEQDGDLLIYNTTNYILYEAVFMVKENEGITMLYDWVDQTEDVNMHYKNKYFWTNK